MKDINNNEHPKIAFGKTGVLLINLGTPNSYKWIDIRNYLKEFLSDNRVIETNKVLWFLKNKTLICCRGSCSRPIS